MAGLIDPTKTGNYPVILGDGLQGKGSNEIFTGIRYNHKPVHSSPSAPSSARLKPSTPGKTTSYDLNYADDDGKYSFTGPRNTDEKQYVLWFDPARKAFILDKVDSTFNMNVTRLPENTDPESLRRQHPPIELPSRPAPKPSKLAEVKAEPESSAPKPRAKPATKPATKPAAKPPVQKKEVKRKPEKKQAPKSFNLLMPVPETEDQKLAREKEEKEKEKAKRRQLEEEEEEDDDDDGGLLVEYPDGDPRTTRQTDFSPAFPSVRRFDDFMNQRESEGDDADGEDDDDPDNDFKLPSPVNHHSQPVLQQPPEPQYEEEEEEDDLGADLEDELEKEMEMAFGDMENSNEPGVDYHDESEVSEED